MIAQYFDSLEAYRAYLQAEQRLNGWSPDYCMLLLLQEELTQQERKRWYNFLHL